MIAERQTAKFHASGRAVTTETRIGEYVRVAGVLFASRYTETVIATGETLTEMKWRSIEANGDLPDEWFSPPRFQRTRLQALLEHLYGERTDEQAVLWSYSQFRRAFPHVHTRAGIEMIGYQILKMGPTGSAVALLQANAGDHPRSASSAFGLGRALAEAGRLDEARVQYQRALALDPGYDRAQKALNALDRTGKRAPNQ